MHINFPMNNLSITGEIKSVDAGVDGLDDLIEVELRNFQERLKELGLWSVIDVRNNRTYVIQQYVMAPQVCRDPAQRASEHGQRRCSKRLSA